MDILGPTTIHPAKRSLRGSMSQSSEVIAPVVLDVTAGGGSIPLESARLGFRTIANDLNPVAALLLRCTVRYPIEHGAALISRFQELSVAFKGRVAKKWTCRAFVESVFDFTLPALRTEAG
jgi:putative DNA methylase